MGLFSKHTQPIRATRGSLESLLDSASNDTTMVENGSGYFEIQVGEVDFAQPKIWAFLVILGPFLDPKYRRHVGDCAKHTEPIPTTRGSLESHIHSAPTDNIMVGNGSGYFEIQAGEVDLAQPKIWAFWAIFGPKVQPTCGRLCEAY